MTSVKKKRAHKADIIIHGRDGKTPIKDKKDQRKDIRGRRMGPEERNLVFFSKNFNVYLENMGGAHMVGPQQMFGQ